MSIQTAIAINIRFSVSEIRPNGTLLSPPTQAHFSLRRSMYTALKTEMAPMVPTTNATGIASHNHTPAIIRIPARASPKG
ncbi:hypothetical protein DQW09_31085 (plasmid) [Ensifer adhaerens]|nr:hypothetical protein DQW09_31085 [Ensifer adhaerens]